MRAANGEHAPLADVGLFDRVARLAANRKLRCVASGFRLQLVPLLPLLFDPARTTT